MPQEFQGQSHSVNVKGHRVLETCPHKFPDSSWNTLDTAAATRISRSGSQLQAQKSRCHKNMQTYPSRIMCTPNFKTVAQITWTQQESQEIQGQGHSFMTKGRWIPKHASAYLPLMDNEHTKFWECSSNTLATAGARTIL